MNIFLAPRSNETSYKNFLSTIENGVDFSIVEPHLEKEGKKILSAKKRLFVWGAKASKESSWKKMEIGDYVFFYKKGELVHVGRMIYKQKKKDLGLALWPPKKNEEPWICIYFLDELKETSIPIKEISKFAEYSKGFIVQGFQPLNDKGTQNIIDTYGSIDNFIDKYRPSPSITAKEEKMSHSEAELLLLKIGRMLGYETYTPDKLKKADGEPLSKYVTLSNIPTRYITPEMMPHVRTIDVIWFKDDLPEYAFEIEHTTIVISGLQRLFQLRHLNTRLFIISDQKNEKKFEKFIESDPYYKHKKQIKFKDYKALEIYFRGVSEFNTINKTFLD